MSVDSASTTRPTRRIPQETVGAAVAPHRDMADGIDPKARLQSGGDGEIEPVIVGRDFGEYRREFGGEQLEAHALGLAHVDHDIVAIGGRVADLADHVGQSPPFGRDPLFLCVAHRLVFPRAARTSRLRARLLHCFVNGLFSIAASAAHG